MRQNKCCGKRKIRGAADEKTSGGASGTFGVLAGDIRVGNREHCLAAVERHRCPSLWGWIGSLLFVKRKMISQADAKEMSTKSKKARNT
jgi:hypothetical protein